MVGVTFLLQSKDLLEPKLVVPEKKRRRKELFTETEEKDEEAPQQTEEEVKETETETETAKKHKETFITFKHKFRTHLLSKSISCFSQQQV